MKYFLHIKQFPSLTLECVHAYAQELLHQQRMSKRLDYIPQVAIIEELLQLIGDLLKLGAS